MRAESQWEQRKRYLDWDLKEPVTCLVKSEMERSRMCDVKGKCQAGITAARSSAKTKNGKRRGDDVTAVFHFCWFPAWLNLRL
jgi:hypothetical protein